MTLERPAAKITRINAHLVTLFDEKNGIMLFKKSGGVCGRVVNTSNCGSGGQEFKPRLSRCFLRQGTLLHFVSLHPGV